MIAHAVQKLDLRHRGHPGVGEYQPPSLPTVTYYSCNFLRK